MPMCMCLCVCSCAMCPVDVCESVSVHTSLSCLKSARISASARCNADLIIICTHLLTHTKRAQRTRTQTNTHTHTHIHKHTHTHTHWHVWVICILSDLESWLDELEEGTLGTYSQPNFRRPFQSTRRIAEAGRTCTGKADLKRCVYVYAREGECMRTRESERERTDKGGGGEGEKDRRPQER